MNNLFMTKWDWSISFCRFIAMMFIIICHFLQYYENELAWWFNVGVQMFLFISGLCFSCKKMEITVIFKHFIKLLVPYYILVTIACGAWVVCSKDANILDIISIFLLWGYGKFLGLHHLWFISYILFSYISTPFIIEILKKLEKSISKMIVGSILLLFGFVVFFELFASYYNAAWMICYILGLIIGRISNNSNNQMIRLEKIVIWGSIILALLFNIIQVIIDYIYMY